MRLLTSIFALQVAKALHLNPDMPLKDDSMLETAEHIETESLGCYKDTKDRAMKEYHGDHKDVQSCAEIAKSKGYQYFGLQYHG